MSKLTDAALAILEQPEVDPNLAKVAAVTLLEAIDSELANGNTVLAVWRWAQQNSDAAFTIMHRYDLLHEQVAIEAMATLLNPESGELRQDLSISVLRGNNLRCVTDEQLLSLARKVISEKSARRVQSILERTSEARTIDPAVFRSIRENLFDSTNHDVRLVATEISGISGSFDGEFVRRCLADSSPEVRAGILHQLQTIEDGNVPNVIHLIEQHLLSEVSARARSAGHLALSSLAARQSEFTVEDAVDVM